MVQATLRRRRQSGCHNGTDRSLHAFHCYEWTYSDSPTATEQYSDADDSCPVDCSTETCNGATDNDRGIYFGVDATYPSPAHRTRGHTGAFTFDINSG